MMRVLLAAGILAGLAAAAVAAPLNPAHVSADAIWVMHIDLDAGRQSHVGEQLRKKVFEQDDARRKIEEFQRAIGMESPDDVFGMTLYGSELKENTGVLLLHAKFDVDKVVGHLKDKPGYTTEKHGDHTLHTWTERRRDDEHTVTAAFHNGISVAGRHKADVKQALDVLDDRMVSLKNSQSPLIAAAPQGTVVLARAIRLSEAPNHLQSPIIAESKRLSIVMGERDKRSFFRGELVTESDDIATEVRNLIEGFRAMILLQPEDRRPPRRLIENLKVDVQNGTVSVEWSAPADEVWKAVEAGAEQMKQRRR